MSHIQFSHQIPPAWKKGDIQPFLYSHEINNLLEELATHTELDPKKYQSLLLAIHRELEEKTGVVFVKSSYLSKHNLNDKKKFFFKFCQLLGQPVSINKEGELIREVKDTGLKNTVDKPVRGHLTDQALAFHSDRADLTAMVCESNAAKGGEFKIGSSAYLVHALKEDPETLKILTKNIPHDLRDEGSDDAKICYHPIIANEESFVVRYIRKFIDSTVRHGIQIENEVVEALNKVNSILSQADFAHEISFEPGDMIIFNNHTTLHARNAFENDADKQRCLLRIWIATQFTRKLPESFKPIFHSIAPGSYRGGIIV